MDFEEVLERNEFYQDGNPIKRVCTNASCGRECWIGGLYVHLEYAVLELGHVPVRFELWSYVLCAICAKRLFDEGQVSEKTLYRLVDVNNIERWLADRQIQIQQEKQLQRQQAEETRAAQENWSRISTPKPKLKRPAKKKPQPWLWQPK